MMIPDTPGQQPHTHDQNDPSPSTDATPTDAEPQALTPDRPPPPVEAAEAEKPSPRPRGFAAMNRAHVRDMARKGGKAAHSAGTAHEFTSAEAREAGRKGGLATHSNRLKAREDQAGSPTAPRTAGH